MTLSLITITATDLAPSGADPVSARLTATLSAAFQNGTTVVEPEPIVGEFVAGELLADDGVTAFAVYPNDAPGTEPMGTTYLIVVEVDNAPIREGTVSVPYDAVDGTIDLSVLMPL